MAKQKPPKSKAPKTKTLSAFTCSKCNKPLFGKKTCPNCGTKVGAPVEEAPPKKK